MISKQVFVFDDTGTFGDTGPAFNGEIAQMHWQPDQADTGADLQLRLIPARSDTGDAVLVFNDNDVLNSSFTRVPVQAGHDISGLDTGVDSYYPIVGAGDRLHARVISGATAAVQGRLYLWIKDH